MVNQQEAGAAFFVATDGDDGWSGSLAEPNAERTDGPFATLARARDAVREMKGADNLNEPVSVMVRSGKHYLEDPLVLGSRDRRHPELPGNLYGLSGRETDSEWRQNRQLQKTACLTQEVNHEDP